MMLLFLETLSLCPLLYLLSCLLSYLHSYLLLLLLLFHFHFLLLFKVASHLL
jgi:hypothetical protein